MECGIVIGEIIRVGIVDDHKVLRDGLRTILDNAGGIETVAEASNADEAQDALRRTSIDVLLTDITLHGLDGIELARRVSDGGDRPRVVMLTMHDEPDIVGRAIRAGAWGYVLKEEAAQTVARAIRAVYEGDHYYSPTIPQELIAEYRYCDEPADEVLTPRQREVLSLICEGLTEREIADHMRISHYTVHVHKNNIHQKLHLHSKVDLVKYAIQHGLVTV